MSIEKELLAATRCKPQKAGESRQKYLVRVMLAVQKLSDEAWADLEAVDGAQDWYNAAIEADNEHKEVPDFSDSEAQDPEDGEDAEDDAADEDDAEEEDADDEDAGGEDDDEDADEGDEDAVKEDAKKVKPAAKRPAAKPVKATKPAKATKPTKPAAKAASAPAAKPAKEAPAAKSTKAAGGKPSMRRALKQIVIKKPKMSTDELIEALERKGYESPSKLTVTSIRADTRDTIRVLNEAGLTSIDL